jgi:hypothetical protein
MQNGTESFRTLPKASASFGAVRNVSERFGNVPHASERKENHSLTVREAARMFEAAGVARTERSIINWCQLNRQGIARLDSYFDPNERKYYITPQSVDSAIQEELQRANKSSDVTTSESFGSPVEQVKHSPTIATAKTTDDRKVQELEREIMDLKITNRGKDMFIEQLKNERTGFFDQLLLANRTMGQLETKLHQLNGPES